TCALPISAGEDHIVGDGAHGSPQYVVDHSHQRIFAVAPLLAKQEQEDVLADFPRNAVAERSLQESDELAALVLGPVREDLPQEPFKTRRPFMQPAPAGGDDRAYVVPRSTVSQFPRAQVENAGRSAQDPRVRVPALGGHGQAGIRAGERQYVFIPAQRAQGKGALSQSPDQVFEAAVLVLCSLSP